MTIDGRFERAQRAIDCIIAVTSIAWFGRAPAKAASLWGNMNPLAKSLLFTMRHARVYAASNLARLHGASQEAVGQALRELIDEGLVRECNNARGQKGYCSTQTAPALPLAQPGDAAVSTTVATFPVTRRLDGVLTDYISSIESHRSLAMLARR
jgi:hypothetical protein